MNLIKYFFHLLIQIHKNIHPYSLVIDFFFIYFIINSFIASTMFAHLQHFLLYYNRMRAKSNSADLQQVFI
jgi:hypothetical protein